MDLDLVKKLVKIVDTSNITDLEIEEGDLKIKIAKKQRNTQVIAQTNVPFTSAQPVIQPSSVPAEAQKQNIESQTVSENLHEIRSPIVGTFYRAPAPDADSYVQVGSVVTPGSVLCIVEAMKLMNEIESDVSGKIVKILVENGKPVEYNQPLFLIELA
ncbi:MAG: acetyl-CoA carboxylase biotin carboxyl carrier protein [Ignavibacteriota bacterium]|jgi:acetyl-CoA carboxylase biotin carboxyl carrier protein|nr:MAG: acetyl-CoA carboxylase biotin carboxyl carrier protein [Chlorobiota bacterium]MBE7476579.1 acetyl-CoA carboxylase biotin carboxyl carrier protein [Ignavibacteriales bacterium]MBL1123719.1 acetyl-CoA carboxylase biotin carboxyl carrier protein [Ignavibacteriota bacterium]MCC7094883.1 acetyl-CoA carboxylase biotin carboxyl carrier protein [Ignavibacteriaceae bacterium]MCE7855606.1 acetyl-CoA carboxylase biotin carboxyl carrier protein [Ignavibacteria bacterium CHB3]MEB2294969.1 acetyl-Co